MKGLYKISSRDDEALAAYAEQGLYATVRLSRPAAAAAAGLLLWARRPGDIDRMLHGRRSAAVAPQPGAQQWHASDWPDA